MNLDKTMNSINDKHLSMITWDKAKLFFVGTIQ